MIVEMNGAALLTQERYTNDSEPEGTFSTLMDDHVEDSSLFIVTKEQLALLGKKQELHITADTMPYNYDEAKEIITGN
jgi:hypothetical protein